MMLTRLSIVAAVLWGLAGSSPALGDDAAGFFAARVAPLFERRCLSCHNRQEHKGNFSLETADDLAVSGYVAPGNPDGSYLLAALTAQDGKRPAMPKDGDPLSAAEVADLRRWIAAGAIWPQGKVLEEARVRDVAWWSWRPLERPAVPALADEAAAWVRTPIDAFILAKLQANGLRPSPEADRRTLARRLWFDLTGLPPTPEDVAAFLDDPDPLAYEKLVDRLLASPQYGERWARHWLDVARYADTHGYDKDKPRPHAWPYRDYAIRAFNEDKPYARFVQEQIAGDVLWPGTADGVVALGFLAAGPWDFIGHVEVPESKYDGRVARNLDRDDMTATALNAFCSLTVQCARCHHHKLDAVSMEDYYRLQAVFAALDRADRPYDADPEVARRRRELTLRQERLQAELADLERQMEARRTPELVQVERSLAELQRQLSAAPAATGARSPAYGYHSAVASRQDEAKWVQVDLGERVALDRLLLFGADEYGWADFGFPERYQVAVSDDADFAHAMVLADRAEGDVLRPGAAPVVVEARGTVGRYVRVTALQLWSRRHKDAAPTNDWIFALGELVVLAQGRVAAVREVTAKDSIEAPPRWGRNNLIDGLGGRAALPQSADELLALARPHEWQSQMEELQRRRKALHAAAVGPALLAAREACRRAIESTAAELASLPPQQMVYAGTVYRGEGNFRGRDGLGPRAIHVLRRGDVNQPGAEVRPGAVPLVPAIPAEFPLSAPADEGPRRAALAQWIVHRDHPLTWRSIVNRVWLYHFGRGLVDTPNDFGRGGQLPSHPELLDWLAVEFRDNGQSLKALHRLICASAVYRQTASVRGDRPDDVGQTVGAAADGRDPQAVDADNRLLWRMNRRRLTAEEIRDATLAVAGRLNLAMGGPGFMDFAIERPEHSPHYEYDRYDPHDPQTHRRAAYRFVVRSQPQPFMDALDCADPSQSVPKREETLTSLQALAMLNNRLMLAMAEYFADRLRRERTTLPEQLVRGFQLTVGRNPEPNELHDLAAYAAAHGLPNACRVLLNLNEFAFVD